MCRAEPVEHRQPHPEERNAEPLRRLAAMRMRDEEIAARRARLEILEIPDQHFLGDDFLERRG